MSDNSSRTIESAASSRYVRRIRRWRTLLAGVLAVSAVALLLTGVAGPAEAIYNGKPADPDASPYIVKVHTVYNNGAQVLCTGSVIAGDAVLTAAHCVRHAPLTPVSVSVTFHADSPRDQYTVTVSKAVPNPGFDVAKYKDDIAVLLLDRSVHEPSIELAESAPAVGSQVVFRGYGCTSDPYRYETLCSAPARQLREMVTQVVPMRQCPTIGGAWDFCTYTKNKSVNLGDSGGPVVQTDEDGTPVLVGLIEAFEDPPSARWSDVSTSIAYHLSWIEETADL